MQQMPQPFEQLVALLTYVDRAGLREIRVIYRVLGLGLPLGALRDR